MIDAVGSNIASIPYTATFFTRKGFLLAPQTATDVLSFLGREGTIDKD
jgi:hypothetical protein